MSAPGLRRLAAGPLVLGLAALVAACGGIPVTAPPAAPVAAPASATPPPAAATAGATGVGLPSGAPTPLPSPGVALGTGPGYPPVALPALSTPTAHGTVLRFTLPAPWTGGRWSLANLAVYLPPHFTRSGAVRYPVIYEVPYGISTWTQPGRFNLPATLDALIGERLVPPEIVVFLGVSGGPYTDSECANSFDGREWVERWIVHTIVPYMDSHYPTVRSRVGRAVMGASQGGYCAAALWSHHPDVFGAAITESGYFVSGIRTGSTPQAWRPFGDRAALMHAESPIVVVPRLPLAERRASLVLLEANPANAFYGRQALDFMRVLAAARVPYHFYPDPLGHAWPAFARETPRLLVDLARWMAGRGVA